MKRILHIVRSDSAPNSDMYKDEDLVLLADRSKGTFSLTKSQCATPTLDDEELIRLLFEADLIVTW